MTKLLPFLFAGFMGLIAARAQAEPQVWQGRIGSAPIVMELGSDSADHAARYFYRKYNIDILLAVEKTESGKLSLTGSEANERMVLIQKGKGWEGQWQGPEGKKLPVTLEPLDLSTIKIKYPLDNMSYYDIAKAAGMRLKAGKKEKFMGHTIEWMEEPTTKINMFRVRDGFPDKTLARINAVLEERQRREIYTYFDCVMNMNGGTYDQKVTPRFLNARFLSVSIFTDYYCGDAHPDFGDNPLNLNIENGKFLELEDFLWVGTGEPQSFPAGDWTLKNIEYWTDIRSPWLLKTLTRLYPKEMEDPPEGTGCDYSDAEIWKFVTMYLTPQGIYVGPVFPRAARVCEWPEWSILPWGVVNKHPGKLKGNLP